MHISMKKLLDEQLKSLLCLEATSFLVQNCGPVFMKARQELMRHSIVFNLTMLTYYSFTNLQAIMLQATNSLKRPTSKKESDQSEFQTLTGNLLNEF
ncbi:hypothetical protein M9Y10_035447 [Tritrichomonas musculus]|uniref:Uncharacterized protein n=1 Tax=Tritrichomonas musculus TaxID=1915356 RepID=A0ABR2KHN7_9EUKA